MTRFAFAVRCCAMLLGAAMLLAPTVARTQESAATVAETEAATETAAPASAPAAGAVPAPPEGKANVVFFRPSSFVGAAIRCTVRENARMIGRLGNGDYFIQAVEPGVHKFTAATEAKDEISIEAEPGETYYVKCKIAAGFMAGRPNLSPADEAAFSAEAAKLDLIDPAKMAEMIAKDEAKQAKAGSK